MRFLPLAVFIIIAGAACKPHDTPHALVFQSDFGLKDGAVSEMKGVAFAVSPRLKMFDLTHEIPPFNIWEASYRLYQTAPYWPKGTVFVSVVDPGVGSSRKSVVLRTKSGHLFVTPDNGTLTLIAEELGIDAVREIDESKNRRQGSGDSYTFHGRDVYAYTGARLAAGVINFDDVGPTLPPEVVKIPYQRPVFESGEINGAIPVLDVQYGNVWTNIDRNVFARLDAKFGDTLDIKIFKKDSVVFDHRVPYVTTFSAVPAGQDMAYLNSLLCFSLGVNQDNFARRNHIQSGADWRIVVRKLK